MRVAFLLSVSLSLTTAAHAQSDGCATATPITGTGAFPFDSAAATSSFFTGAGPGTCFGNTLKDVFWAWTAPAGGTYVVSTCDATIDSTIKLYAGTDCSATCVGSFEDGCGDDPRFVLRDVAAGDTFLVQLGSQLGGTGTGDLVIEVAPGPPPNDTCAAATPIIGTGAFPMAQTFATTSGFDGGGLCNPTWQDASPLLQDVFFQWTADAAGDFRFTLCGHSADPYIVGLEGMGCAATCVIANNVGPCNTSFQPGLVLVDVQPGDTYLIHVPLRLESNFAFVENDLLVEAVAAPPANNDCAQPEPVANFGSWPFDTSTATSSGFHGLVPSAECGDWPFGQSVFEDVFFVWTAPQAGPTVFRVTSDLEDVELNVYTGSDCSATCRATGPTGTASGTTSATVSDVTAGETFLIQVGGWGLGDTGAGRIRIERPVFPAFHDTCATALPIGTNAAGEAQFAWTSNAQSTSGFDGGNSALCHSGANAPGSALEAMQLDSFFTWTPGVTGPFRITTFQSFPSDVDTLLNVHLGSDCSATCLASNDDIDAGAGNLYAAVELTASACSTYLIQVGIWDTGFATFQDLTIESIGPPPPALTLGCTPAAVHHEGGSATLACSHFGSGVGSGLRLDCTDGPPGEFAFFVLSATGGGASLPVFSGVFCLEQPTNRYNPQVAMNQGLPQLSSVGQFDEAGVYRNLSGTATSHAGRGFDVPIELPFSPPGQTIASGDTLYFQLWFRDEINGPGDTANFSDMIEATFP